MSLIERFRGGASRRQLMVVAIAAVGALIALSAVYLLVLRRPYAPLFSNLKDVDAATIVAELEKNKVPYRLRDDGSTILVPKDRVDATRLEVVGADLPLKGLVGFELFNKSDMGLTEFAQRINYQRALQGELARTIMTMEGIDTARVHLTIPEETVFRGDRKPPKASVTVIPAIGGKITPATVGGIQRLVAAAVAELEVGNVIVLNERGAVISGEVEATVHGAVATPERQAIAQHFTTRIRQSLDSVYDPQDLQVTVWPDLDVRRPLDAVAAPWPDGPRDFRLRVSVSLSPAVAADSVAQVRELTAEAIGFDARLGDIITIGASVTTDPPQAIAAPAGSQGMAVPKPAAAKHRGDWGLWVSVALALTLLFVGGAVIVRLRRPGGLDPQQRQAFAARLTTLLDEREAHVASRH